MAARLAGGGPRRSVATAASVSLTLDFSGMPTLLPLSGPFGVWSALIAAGFFGIWSERTRLGKELSGALVATLAGMLLANTGVIPHGAPELHCVYKYLLPLAIPMLLFSADLRCAVQLYWQADPIKRNPLLSRPCSHAQRRNLLLRTNHACTRFSCRRIISQTGRLLAAFLLGSVATVAGSWIAYAIFPLGRFLGDEGWKVRLTKRRATPALITC
jgi:uncharacterized membrane protein